MKFVCLGYADLKKMQEYSPEEFSVLMEECFAYDDELRRGGHFVGGEALESPDRAATVRPRDGKVVVTEGPYAETKEQLGGILFLEARDLEHAVALMSRHPGVRFGPFEIRPANVAINELIAARDKKVRRVVRPLSSLHVPLLPALQASRPAGPHAPRAASLGGESPPKKNSAAAAVRNPRENAWFPTPSRRRNVVVAGS